MSTTDKIIDLVKEVGNENYNLKRKCKKQNQHVVRLAKRLRDAYDEIRRMNKKLRRDLEPGGSLAPRDSGRDAFTDLLENVLRILAARGDLGTPSQTTRELLKCRLLNKDWKTSIGNLFQGEIFPTLFPTSVENGFTQPKFLFEYSKRPWLSPWIADKTISADTNPIVSRFLEFHESYDRCENMIMRRDKQKFREDLLEFLKKFGHHVWYFKIQIGSNGMDKVSTVWFTTLTLCLAHLPNLRALHIYQPMFSWWEKGSKWTTADYYESANSDGEELINSSDTDNGTPKSTSNESTSASESNIGHQQRLSEIKNLRDQIRSESFPTVASLKTLVLEDCVPSLATSVLKNNPQIERLKIIRREGNKKNTCKKDVNLNELQEFSLHVFGRRFSEIEAIKCKNLQKLTVDYSFDRDLKWDNLNNTLQKCFGETLVELTVNYWQDFTHSDFDSSTDIHHGFENDINSSWKSLKKLTVTCANINNWSEFFHSFSTRFGAAVPELTLKVNEGTIWCTEYPRLLMSNLKVLNLDLIYESYTSIDFLLPLLSLEFLNVTVKLFHCPLYEDNNEGNNDNDEVSMEIVNLFQMIRNVRESNIWQLLPKLKKVKIRTDQIVSYEEGPEMVKSAWQLCTRSEIEEK